MLKRPQYIALGLVVIMTVAILNLPSQTAARLKVGLGSLFLPLFGLTTASQRMIDKTGDSLTPRGELLRQNETYRQENQRLRLELQEAENVRRENEKLRQLLAFQQRTRLKVKSARVVLSEPANWWRTVQIDLGARDGVSNNLPVLSPEGYLVGRIFSTSLTKSQVVLVGDPKCKVAARVENSTGDTGIIGASGPLDTGYVEMGFLSRNANLKPGQVVKTSGKGGFFPENITIGAIVDTRSAEYGLSSVARVKLAANLSALEEVWVRFP